MGSILAGTQIPVSQAVQYARDAGFTGNSLTYVVAIAMGESSLWTHAVNTSDPYGGSFGILQINGAHFGETLGGHVVSQATCFDPAISFRFGFAISNGGSKFSDWGAYSSGRYTNFIAQVQPYTGYGSAGSTPPTVTGAHFPGYNGQAWYNYPMYSDSDFTGPSGYHNTDVGTPTDTPITAPVAGVITSLGYYDWGGQVSWKVDNTAVTLGVPEIFVIHMDAINPNLKVGQHISAGTFLGYSGGQLSNFGLPPLPNGLQHHTTSAAHTTGPHLDIGVTDSPTASLDTNQAASNNVVQFAKHQALPYGTGIDAANSASSPIPTAPTGDTSSNLLPIGFTFGSTVSYNKLSENVHNTLVQNPGFYGMALALDQAEQFPGLYNAFHWTDIINPEQAWSDTAQTIFGTIVGNTLPIIIRGTFVLIGFAMLFILLWQLLKPSVEAIPELLPLLAMVA